MNLLEDMLRFFGAAPVSSAVGPRPPAIPMLPPGHSIVPASALPGPDTAAAVARLTAVQQQVILNLRPAGDKTFCHEGTWKVADAMGCRDGA